MYPLSNYENFYTTPKFNLATEPHYKIRKYLEDNSINFPNNKMLDKIISTALNKKKYQGTMDLNVPGNKNVLTDSDSEQNYNMKKINKNMLKQNGCANLIITKIESQAPQRNEEYYKFTNQKKYFVNNDPIYGTRTLTNWNHKNINLKKPKPASPLYIPTEQNNFYNHKNNYNNNYNAYTTNRILTTSDTSIKNKLIDEKNIMFDSAIDLQQINANKKNINHKNKAQNQQTSYESSAEAEHASSSYVYHPAKINMQQNKNSNIKKNIFKENDFSEQTISNNEEPYIKKKFEIKSEKIIKTKPKINIYKIPNKKPTINELINLNYNIKGFSVLQNKFNLKLVKNVLKIQSAWRGHFIRESLNKDINLARFVMVLVENINNKYLDYIEEFFNKMKNMKISSDKNENYDDLLKDYNLLLDEYNKIENEMNQIKKIHNRNHFDNLNIVKKENNFEILDINLDSNLDNKEQENINNNKIFDIIQPEQKEEFSIMKISKKNINLRNIPKKINKEEIKNNIEDNIHHFTSNINIINNTNFTLKENKQPISSKENNQIIKNECLSLLQSSKNNKELNQTNKIPILIEEHQQNMNIHLLEKNESPKKFKNIMVKENKNDINIIPIIPRNKLYKKKLCKFHHEFNEEKLIIVKKSNINIHCDKKEKIFNIDKNTLHIKKSKKPEQNNIVIEKNDFNKINEIDQRDALEINTIAMKKFNKKEKNVDNKETKADNNYTEKAKKNIMKMIFPIRLKAVLKEFVRKIVIKILKNYKDN